MTQPLLSILILLLHAPRWLVLAALVCLGLLIIGLSRRRAVFTSVVILSLASLFGAYSGYQFPGFEQEDVGPLTLKTINLNLGRRASPTAVQQLVDQHDPDFVALQECGAGFFNAFILRGYEGHHVGGLCTYSKWPLVSAGQQKGSAVVQWRGIATASFEVDWLTPFRLINVHLMTPRPALEAMLAFSPYSGAIHANTVARDREADRLASDISRADIFVALGDFNLVADDPIYYRHFGKFANAFSERGAGFGLTKLYSNDRFGVRIDHLLTDGNFRVVESTVLPDVGSDHLPLLSKIEFVGY